MLESLVVALIVQGIVAVWIVFRLTLIADRLYLDRYVSRTCYGVGVYYTYSLCDTLVLNNLVFVLFRKFFHLYLWRTSYNICLLNMNVHLNIYYILMYKKIRNDREWKRNWTLDSKSNFLFHLSVQPHDVNLRYFQLGLFILS